MKEKIDSAKHTEQIKILFSRFSHELRNPLALLSSELQLLASSHPQLSNDEQSENMHCWMTCRDTRMQDSFLLF